MSSAERKFKLGDRVYFMNPDDGIIGVIVKPQDHIPNPVVIAKMDLLALTVREELPYWVLPDEDLDPSSNIKVVFAFEDELKLA